MEKDFELWFLFKDADGEPELIAINDSYDAVIQAKQAITGTFFWTQKFVVTANPQYAESVEQLTPSQLLYNAASRIDSMTPEQQKSVLMSILSVVEKAALKS